MPKKSNTGATAGSSATSSSLPIARAAKATKRNAYTILGIPRTANEHEIKEAYAQRKRLLNSESKIVGLEDLTGDEVDRAYLTLMTPKKRAALDATLPEIRMKSPIRPVQHETQATTLASEPYSVLPRVAMLVNKDADAKQNELDVNQRRSITILMIGADHEIRTYWANKLNQPEFSSLLTFNDTDKNVTYRLWDSNTHGGRVSSSVYKGADIILFFGKYADDKAYQGFNRVFFETHIEEAPRYISSKVYSIVNIEYDPNYKIPESEEVTPRINIKDCEGVSLESSNDNDNDTVKSLKELDLSPNEYRMTEKQTELFSLAELLDALKNKLNALKLVTDYAKSPQGLSIADKSMQSSMLTMVKSLFPGKPAPKTIDNLDVTSVVNHLKKMAEQRHNEVKSLATSSTKSAATSSSSSSASPKVEGLLVLDLDDTLTTTADGSNYYFLPGATDFLNKIAATGLVDMIILTGRRYCEKKAKLFDDTFGVDRTFLTRDDIYDPVFLADKIVDNDPNKCKMINTLREQRGHESTLPTLFIDDTEKNFENSDDYGITTLQTPIVGELPARLHSSFYAKTALEECDDVMKLQVPLASKGCTIQ